MTFEHPREDFSQQQVLTPGFITDKALALLIPRQRCIMFMLLCATRLETVVVEHPPSKNNVKNKTQALFMALLSLQNFFRRAAVSAKITV